MNNFWKKGFRFFILEENGAHSTNQDGEFTLLRI